MQQQTTLADKIIAKYNLYELLPRSPEPKIYFNERIKLALAASPYKTHLYHNYRYLKNIVKSSCSIKKFVYLYLQSHL